MDRFRIAMESAPVSASSSTTTRFSMAPVPRIPAVPLGIMGIPTMVPRTPGFVTEKVAPWISSGFRRRLRARSDRSTSFFPIPTRLSSSASWMTGTMSPGSRSTATPTFTLPRKIRLFPETVPFMFGNSLKRREQAHTTKVSYTACSAHRALFAFRISSTRVKSISMNEWTCGATLLASTMCSAVSRRILSMGSTRSAWRTGKSGC